MSSRSTVPLTPRQRLLLQDELAHRGTGRQIGQISRRWHGPLDTDRFVRAWQAVVDREVVLRAAFDWRPEPRAVLYRHATAQVVRYPAGDVDLDALREHDRLRGFDLRRPGLLRVTLVDGQERAAGGGAAHTWILLTFHQAMLDGWSVSVLLQEFYRAYLGEGSLPGGERRPDIRDYARWLKLQDTAPARAFWSHALSAGALAVLPGIPGHPSVQRGVGRAQARLSAAEADALRTWAAGWAATESSALQAVWGLILHRVSGRTEAGPVAFGVSVSGRHIALEAAERLPGPLVNSLPMIIQVDPAHSLLRLLAGLRDQELGMAAYEWVSPNQLREWGGRPPGDRLVESLLVYESHPHTPHDLEAALADQGITVEPHVLAVSQTAFPVTLLARRDEDGSLVVAAVHDRSRISDADAARLVGRCARLLRELPGTADEATTVGDVLLMLTEPGLPRIAPRPRPQLEPFPSAR